VRIRLFHTEGFRVAAIFVGIFAISAAAMATAVLVITDDMFRDQIVRFATADIAAVREGYSTKGEHEAREIIDQRMAAPGASDFFLLQKDGQKLMGNLAPMPERTGVINLPGRTPKHDILGVAAELAPGLYVFSGSDLYRTELTRTQILWVLLWIFAVALVLSALAGSLVSRRFLYRTDMIAQTCRAIMNGDLKTRIPVRGTQDELDRLSQTINAMLDRIAALMENLHQVTNDIAHDLRTPVTHLRHRLERARGQAAPADYDRALEAAILASDEILALFAALLRIAQIEGGARRAGFAPVELAELLQQLRDMLGPVADDAGHQLTLAANGKALVRGDRELLVQLFSNLIENAIVHTPQGTRIDVMLQAENDAALVTISDNGPGVPPEEHSKLFRRFYRQEASRTRPGYGLGLALVQAIAELHEAKLRIMPAGRGFAVRIALPLA
jgi:signal transduction histidine kinase